ncbi:MAG: DUF167 domain-containing protein [Chloroflexi bacterium]|nr:MAG: DUF167 domain-containing protein [Chloroflexota bacterium]
MRDIKFNITKAEEGAAFLVHVVPKSAKNEVVGKYGDALKINLTSKTVSGGANDTLVKFFAKKLNVKQESVEIAAGLTSTEKMVVVVGLSPKKAEKLLLG